MDNKKTTNMIADMLESYIEDGFDFEFDIEIDDGEFTVSIYNYSDENESSIKDFCYDIEEDFYGATEDAGEIEVEDVVIKTQRDKATVKIYYAI